MFGGVACLAGCSILTSLDGLTGGERTSPGLSEAGADSGAGIADAGADASKGTDAGGRARVWRQISASGPPAQHSVRMAYDEARQKSVLFGEATWEWSGLAWARVGDGPAGTSVGLAYDSARQVTMLAGGAGTSREPWEWNGATWKATAATASGPTGFFAPALAYDRARNVLVAFGGFDTTTNIDDGNTWEWSAGSGFVKRTLLPSPPARSGHVMVYDRARSRIVLVGGGATQLLDDVWEYDGSTWSQPTPAISPPPRRAACAAFDADRGVTVVFGGRTADKAASLADTWEWNGTSWRQGPSGPPARRTCAMTFDVARNAVVMFGGSPGRKKGISLALGDTWVYE